MKRKEPRLREPRWDAVYRKINELQRNNPRADPDVVGVSAFHIAEFTGPSSATVIPKAAQVDGIRHALEKVRRSNRLGLRTAYSGAD